MLFFVSQEVYVSVREKKRYCKFSWKYERRKIFIDNNEKIEMAEHTRIFP